MDGRAFAGRSMSKIVGGLVVLALAALAGPLSAGELRRESIASSALGRDMSYLVYVPDHYQTSHSRYPVLYLLHGAGGDENDWTVRGNIKERADKLIASGEIPPTLIVMPGCQACWWIDGAKDKAETAFWSELVPNVSRRYRTIASRNGMLIAGQSAGGYGAIRFAMKYPDRIAVAAAFSPAIYREAPPLASSARLQPPFLRPSGEFDQAMWTAQNYPRLVDHYFSQQFRVPFYLISGDHDRFGIAMETAQLFSRLFAQQPQISELRIVDGDHSWDVWSNAIEGAMKYLYRFAAPPEDDPSELNPSEFMVVGRR